MHFTLSSKKDTKASGLQAACQFHPICLPRGLLQAYEGLSQTLHGNR